MPPRRTLSGLSQNPSVRYAEVLARLRAQSGDTLRDLEKALGWDFSLFGKLESGKSLGSPEVAQALDQHYGTGDLLFTLWELASSSPTQFRERYQRYMMLESSEATGIQQYSPAVVPGLLQTEAYAREVLTLGGMFPGDELDQQVAARVNRRDVITRDGGPNFRAILDEAVLRRTLPDPSDWSEQLKALLDFTSFPHVSLQVLPFSENLREMSNTDVSFLRLRDGRTVAWVETGYNGELIDDAVEVERLQFRYDGLRDHALSPSRSSDFIQHVMEEG